MRPRILPRDARRAVKFLLACACLAIGVSARTTNGAEPVSRTIAAKGAVDPAAPVLPAEVVAAMQEGRFDDAEGLLKTLSGEEKNPATKAYLTLIQGIAERLGGKAPTAEATLAGALKADPASPWAAKIRLELAGVLLSAGKAAEAEALARNQAEILLGGDRKDRLAEVYHAFARRLLRPDDPVTPADPKAAYELLIQARSLAKGETLRARLLNAMGRAARAANDLSKAQADFQSYIKEYPKGADRFEVRDRLGQVQRSAGQMLAARLTWTDLARDLDDPKLGEGAESVRARALDAIASTYGIPKPGDDTQLNLGVAALRRFLGAFPAHPLAVKAAYEIGASYLARGKSEEALEALTRFLKEDGFRAETDDAKRDFGTLSMTATFQVGQVLQGQSKFDEAIAAWKGYLAKYPNGPQSADAQRAILDTQLLNAADHLAAERFDEARAAWQVFVTQNPLDPRVPDLLYQIGASYQTQEKYDAAITAWEPLLSKFPGGEAAAHAQFDIAKIFEDEKGDLETAIERYRKINVDPWQSQAKQQISVLETKDLTVVTPRTFRTGETPHLKITTRNLETLTFSAYKLNAESYFRKKRGLGEVEALDIGLVAADAEWTAKVPGYARFKPVETTYDLDKLELPGVYVVKVSDEKTLQATTLVVGSDLDAIIKASRDQMLVFVQDMKTGKGRPDARVLVADGGEVILETKTGADGVALTSWEKPRDVNSRLSYLILDGSHVASSEFSVPDRVAQGLSAKAYLYTDRPAYRPGQSVALRGIVREVEKGQYANPAKAVYKLDVTDARGRQIVARPVTLSDFGTFHEEFPIDSGAPVGTYRVRLYQPGKSDFAASFEVQAYQLQKMDLTFDLKKSVFFRGETVSADLVAKYQYGEVAAGRPVVAQLPDGRVLRGKTDASGKFHIDFPTSGFAEEQVLRLVAQLPEDGVGAIAQVALVVRAFAISVGTTRTVYLDGETFSATVKTWEAQGTPIDHELSVALVKLNTRNNRTTERVVSRKMVTTDAKTGEAQVSLKAEDEQGGRYLIRVSGTDQFGNPIVADRGLLISGKKDEATLRILADRQSYKVGEEASVNLHSRGKGGTALLTWEADRILSYRLVTLAEGDNAIAWTVDGPQFPNFTLNACRMAGKEFNENRLDIRVERALKVTLTPSKALVGPGDEVELEVTTADQLGQPVAAELAVALVDQSLLRRFASSLQPIGPFFYDQTRTGAFSTDSTNTFTYESDTTPVAMAVVEDAERSASAAANAQGRGAIVDEAKKQVAAGLNSALQYSFTARSLKSINAPAATPAAPMGGFAPTELPVAGRQELARNNLPREYAILHGEGLGEMDLGLGANRVELDMKRSQLAVAGPETSVFFDRFEVSRGADASEKRDGIASFSDIEQKGSGEASRKLSERRGMLGRDVQVRERFVETAYWNPAIVTGKDGKAKITLRAPNALSEYAFSARGVTGADTLVGQSAATLVVRKAFFVDLKTPAALTQGDKPRFVASVHHSGVVGAIKVRLSAYAGDRDQVDPKTIEVKGDGIDEVFFDPFEVPEGESVRLTVTAEAGDRKDEVIVEVPVRPWGVQAFASASGTSSDDATAFVGLPAGRTYENPEMLIVVSPTLQRLLIELAVGRDLYPGNNPLASSCVFPRPPMTTADRASDLLAATSALTYVRSIRGGSVAPEATRLTDRVRGLVAELTALQGENGGWPWVGGGAITPQMNQNNNNAARKSDRMTSARVVWALASAEPLGLLTDPSALDKAANYLTAEYARIGAGDHETRAMVLHALSTRGKANFENANTLNRLRQGLSDAALAYLALTFENLDRGPLAGEILDLLGPRAKSEIQQPGDRPLKYWGGSGSSPTTRSVAETTALVALAYAKGRPQAAETAASADWLLAKRQGFGWRPHKAKGPALAALAAYYAKGQGAEDRFDLVVTVNETEVYRARIVGATEGKALLVPAKALKVGDKNRVRFDIEGRGRFGYSITLTGFSRDFTPEQDPNNRSAHVHRRVYLPDAPELDGKALPTGFGVAVNPTVFENQVSQVALGGRARIQIDAYRNQAANQPEWERDFLVVEEHLPAGVTLIEGSVQSQAESYSNADGLLTFYFAPDQNPGPIRYDVHGYLPGAYRALPTSVRNAYEPGRAHLGTVGGLRVLDPGEAGSDPYKATPDELYARGKGLFEAGKLVEAAAPLEALFNGYTLRDDVARDASRMLLLASIKGDNPRKVVQYFEVVKEKAPDLVITFDDLLVIGRAYRDIHEFERAYLVWRGVVEASYLEDARVGEVLRQRGKALEGIAYLLDLWREYPDTASIESDFFAISQVLARQAGQALNDPKLRQELTEAGITRSMLLLQSIRLTQAFLALSPQNPLADEASLALVGDFLELEDFGAVVRLSGRYARLYPKSTFLDSFQYSEALGEFHLGHYDRAVEVAGAIASATYKDAAGADQPSPNKWQAIYILGQIFDARRQPGKAVGYYREVADRFTDAADALTFYTRKNLKIPEVTVILPGSKPGVAAVAPRDAEVLRSGMPAVPKRARTVHAADPPDELTVESRNIAEADVKVYPVDLMRLYLTRRNLDAIAGIDLAGITPVVETTVKLGKTDDFAEKVRAIDLDLKKEGAYLVMVRGENLYASGIVLVTPLELEVLEEPAGRVRVTVRDAVTGDFVSKVQVKVIGSRNADFITGETDLRGVFLAEGIQGEAAAVARKGTAQYAFYRGTTSLGTPPPEAIKPAATPADAPAAAAKQPEGATNGKQSLEDNLRTLNNENQLRNIDRLEKRYQNPAQASPSKNGAAAGGFR